MRLGKRERKALAVAKRKRMACLERAGFTIGPNGKYIPPKRSVGKVRSVYDSPIARGRPRPNSNRTSGKRTGRATIYV